MSRYELLDEVMDNGYPQITDPTVLRSLITQTGFHAAENIGQAALEMLYNKVSGSVTGCCVYARSPDNNCLAAWQQVSYSRWSAAAFVGVLVFVAPLCMLRSSQAEMLFTATH